ncbi:MAG: alpha/beta hydrolase [Gemmatimonadales bacterium]
MTPRVLAAVLLALTLAPGGAAAQAAPWSADVNTVEFYSPAVGRTMKYAIVLPPDYETSDERYPVLYLLHGLSQNYTTWNRIGAPFYAREIGDLILVMPDGGNSWYVNWAESEGGEKNAWEDHIVKDVVGHVDENYRTIARREGRAIAGLSMGGYGALTIGLRNSPMFISIGSTSGALEHARQETERLRAGMVGSRPQRSTQVNPAIGIEGFGSQDERTPHGREFVTVEQAEAHDPFLLINTIPRHRMPHIYLDSGTEDELIQSARALAYILMQKSFPFDLMQLSGAHDEDYWRQSVGHLMTIQYEVMRRALGDRPGR